MEAVPTVFGADEQRDVPVDVARWVRLAQLVLDEERVIERLGADTEMSLLFVDTTTISELNERFLGGSRPDRRARLPDRRRAPAVGPPAGSRRTGPGHAGRPVAILRRCSATSSSARRSRAARPRSASAPAEDELALLVVHGVLHLLDYDHAEPNEGVVMRRREQELLARFREIEGRA